MVVLVCCLNYIDPQGKNSVAIGVYLVAGIVIYVGAQEASKHVGEAVEAVRELGNVYGNKSYDQNAKTPRNVPPGTIRIDTFGKKHSWSKDKLHGIKAAAHGGACNGKSWTGVALEGEVGINEGG